ncbi:hypothetical protein LP419_02130 [Massilia sp. H-1]|nr:hypothetical protein LP419_02130 [Massilia sp. H-1]
MIIMIVLSMARVASGLPLAWAPGKLQQFCQQHADRMNQHAADEQRHDRLFRRAVQGHQA